MNNKKDEFNLDKLKDSEVNYIKKIFSSNKQIDFIELHYIFNLTSSCYVGDFFTKEEKEVSKIMSNFVYEVLKFGTDSNFIKALHETMSCYKSEELYFSKETNQFEIIEVEDSKPFEKFVNELDL